MSPMVSATALFLMMLRNSDVSGGRMILAGVGGLELRNVDANYLFERSQRFAGIQPNSGFGDYSRLSCGVGDTQLGRS
jgi:hypothetical protein